MKRFIRIQLIAWCLSTGAALQVLAQPGGTMYVNGRNLYSAVGEKVMLRGVNEMFIYSNEQH